MPVDVTENYIRIKQRDSDDFQKDSIRTITISASEGIKALVGRLPGETTTTIQSYLFDKEKWTVEKAKKWVSEHKADKKSFTDTRNAWDVVDRQLSQDKAEYNSLGFGDSIACANCQWFISPDSCVLVYGDVSPTGKCRLHLLKVEPDEMEPLPVKIIEDKSFIAKVAEKIRGLHKREPPKPFVLFKDINDNWRFIAAYSNNFKDRESEIFTLEAHKEYVKWVTDTGNYPELWLWHGGKSWGKCDWIDESNGFVFVSGKVDPKYNHIAEALSKEEVAVSHGYVGLVTKSKHMVRYRTFEVSPLPKWAASNLWTSFNLVEGTKMGFSDAKKKWLKEVANVPEEEILDMERRSKALAESLKELGIDWKGIDVDGVSELGTAIEAVTKVTNQVKELLDQVKEAQKEVSDIKESISTTIDEKVADIISPKDTTTSHSPATSEDTVTSETVQKETDDWFAELALGGM